MFNQPAQPPGAQAPGSSSVCIATYGRYDEAQTAVDTLSDDGFPVAGVTIVWRGLRRVEHVTGRQTTPGAAAEGAVAGAWFGSLIGLLFAVLADDGSAIVFVLSYLVVGALAGAAWRGAGHALQRGKRDFASMPRIDAETYELWVVPELVAAASSILGIRDVRPTDPDGSSPDPPGGRADP